MHIFSAQFVVVEENLWFSDSSWASVSRRTTQQRIHVHLFTASDAEDAFRIAGDMVSGFSDANHDGPGERTNYFCIGLHDIDEVSLYGRSVAECLSEPYGLDVAVIDGADSVAVAANRQDLTLFKYPQD